MTGWPQNAHVGQRVTPTDGEGWFDWPALQPVDGPRFGEVYRVTAVSVGDAGAIAGRVLIEVDGFEGLWSANAFRPVKDTSAAVEELKRIALKPSLPAGEPVA